jgi:hypothetical protein
MFDGSGGALTVSICIPTGSESLIGPTSRAIATWNALIPTTENCTGCTTWEETPTAGDTFHAETTLLHELGHCPLGLEHPFRNWDAANDGFWEPTSFTRSWDVAAPPLGIDSGPDFIRGTLDDVQLAPGGPPNAVHWFRKMDNNPFTIDGTVIDLNTYSRSVTADLPAGHSWAANGNRRVGETLGVQNTQTVMYGSQVPGMRLAGLSADDVNMVKMAMTGVDWEAGTADDYTIQMQLVSPCEDADVVVTFWEPTGLGSLAECITGVDFSFPQNPFLTRHINIVPFGSPGEPFIIILDEGLNWITDEPMIFSEGFETGDFSGWDAVSP